MKLSTLMISAVCRMILYVSSVCHDSLTRNLKNNSDRKIRWSKIRVLERKVNVFLSSPPPSPITRSWRVNTIDVSFILFTVLCFKLFLFVSLVNTRLFHSLHWVAINLFCPHLNSCENVICLTSVEQKCIVVNNKCIAVTNGLDLFYFSFAPQALKSFLFHSDCFMSIYFFSLFLLDLNLLVHVLSMYVCCLIVQFLKFSNPWFTLFNFFLC